MELNQLRYYIKLKTILEIIENGTQIPTVDANRIKKIKNSIAVLEKKEYAIIPKRVD